VTPKSTKYSPKIGSDAKAGMKNLCLHLMSKKSSMMPRMMTVARVPYANPYDASLVCQNILLHVSKCQTHLLERKAVQESSCLDFLGFEYDILVAAP
jgi:hypothetical protein